jgi:hypothetical protein
LFNGSGIGRAFQQCRGGKGFCRGVHGSSLTKHQHVYFVATVVSSLELPPPFFNRFCMAHKH